MAPLSEQQIMQRLEALQNQIDALQRAPAGFMNSDERHHLLQRVDNLATELQVITEISTQAATSRDVEQFLHNAVRLIKERFDLYHTQVYLLDGHQLVLLAATGKAGSTMLQERHAIPLDKEHSLVARAARTHAGAVASDVSDEPDFLANPLLPDTASEMALPMLAAGKLIGVLDLQATQPGFFSRDDLETRATLASQIAVAIQNAELVQETQARNKALEDFRSALDQSAIVAITDVQGKITYVNDKFCEVSQYSRAELIGQDHRIINSGYHPESFIRNLWVTIANGETWQGQICNRAKDGSIYWVDTTIVPFLNEMGKPTQYIAIRFLVTEQKRIEEEVRQRAIELQTVADVSLEAATVLETDVLLHDVVNLTRERFNLYHAQIYVLDEASEALVLAAGAGEAGQKMLAKGHSIPLMKQQSLVASAARHREGLIVNNVADDPGFLPNPLLPDTQSEMAVPMVVGDRLLGVLDVQSEMVDRFTEDDLRIKTTLASQVAVALQNALQFEETRAAERQAREISRFQQAILKNAAYAIIATDPDGTITVFNQTAEKMLGYSAKELIGKESPAIFHDLDEVVARAQTLSKELKREIEPGFEVFVARAKQGRADEREWTYIHKDGSRFPVLLSITALRNEDGEISGFLGIAQDITERKRTQQELDRTFNLSLDMIGAANSDGYFIQLNPAWEKTLGWSHEELMAEPFLSFVHPDDVERTLSESAKIFESGQDTLLFENRYRCKDGSYRWISWRSAVDADRQTTYFIARDVTERIQSQEQIKKRAVELQTVAEVSAEAATTLDMKKLLQNAVDLTVERFDLYHAHTYLLNDDGDLLVLAAGAGQPGRMMVEQGHAIPLHAERSLVAQAAREKRGVIVNDVTEEPDFLPNPLLPDTRSEMAIPMIVGDQVIGVLDVQAAVTDRFFEEDVRIKTTLASQLAVGVQNARLYTEQVETAEQLREVDRLKSEFLASMSHELRTPLNSIIGYAEVILDGLNGPLNEDMEEDVNAIYGSGKLLLTLINEILDLAKIEARQLDLNRQAVDVNTVVKSVVDTAQILLKDKPVDLRLVIPGDVPPALADHVRLQQILNNLVSNAVKFTEEGSITIAADVEDEMLIFRVTDTGMGIEADKLDIVFERFRQTDQSSTRKAGGTGLGLAITRELVELHGGDIWVESEMGQGSSFIFTMPVAVTTTSVAGD